MLPTVVVAHFQFPHPLTDFRFTFLFILILTPRFHNTTIVIRIVGNAPHASTQNSKPPPVPSARTRSMCGKISPCHYCVHLLLPPCSSSCLTSPSFGVILLLGGSNFSTLEVEIYLRVLKLPTAACRIAFIVQLIFPLIFLFSTPAPLIKSRPKPRRVFQPRVHPKPSANESLFLLFTYYSLLFSLFHLIPSPSAPDSPRKRTVVNAAKFNTDYNRLL
ncbi:MAG: hypothetical protein IPL71_23005 [Anaerolineales bacterium]|uniref:hypothetical protein n=1 Tax=Candidatus Villigracilis proximus TaxID=3140683 RepID=UPI003134953F|nr:hypothetical protein [Anaerolineales bacterium]